MTKPARKTRPRTLADIADRLFPHSPIEVHKDFTIIAGEKVEEFHVYIEGQWYSKEEDFRLLVSDIANIIHLQGDDWYYPSTRVVPDWVGWARISQCDLAEFRGWKRVPE